MPTQCQARGPSGAEEEEEEQGAAASQEMSAGWLQTLSGEGSGSFLQWCMR